MFWRGRFQIAADKINSKMVAPIYPYVRPAPNLLASIPVRVAMTRAAATGRRLRTQYKR